MELDACTRCQECTRHCTVHGVFPDDPATDPMARLTRWKENVHGQYGWFGPLFHRKKDDRPLLAASVVSSFLCTTCGLCQEVCEAGISLVGLWESMRENLVSQGCPLPGPLEDLRKTMESFGNPYGMVGTGQVTGLFAGPRISEGAVLGYFPGCTVLFRQPETGTAAVRILSSLHTPFCVVSGHETCCASVLIRIGAIDAALPLIITQIRSIEKKGIRTLLFTCAGCYRTVSIDWPRLTGRPLPFRTLTFSEFLLEKVRDGSLVFDRDLPVTVTYHDPCHAGRHVQGFMGREKAYEAPRKLLLALPGVTLVEMEKNRERQTCCGAGGGVMRVSPKTALACAGEKILQARRAGATEICTTCPFCRGNLQKAAQGMEGRIPLIPTGDITVLVARAMGLDTEEDMRVPDRN